MSMSKLVKKTISKILQKSNKNLNLEIMKAIVMKAKDHDSVVMISDNNPEQAVIMVKSIINSMNEQGFLQQEVRVGLVKGKTELLNSLGLKEGDDYSVKVSPVKLVVKESTEPAFATQKAKINPTTQEVITHLKSPVYRTVLVVSEGLDVQDVKLTTDREEVAATATATAKEESFK